MISLFKKLRPSAAQGAPGEGDFFRIFAEGEDFAALQGDQRLSYQAADPFPHIVIDGMFRPDVLKEVLAEVPSPLTSADLFTKDVAHLQEKKFAWRDVGRLGPKSLRLINYLYSKPFLEYVTAVTGIEGLVPDPYLWGAGFHQILRGGKLAVHADFNIHPQMKLYRRLNIIVYLNENWQPGWRGNLELWSPQMDRCVQSVSPDFNRTVIFSTTDTSYHGHPDPLESPSDVVRRSLALYYYTFDRLHEQVHSTLWQPRPGDEDAVAEAVEAHRREHG